METSETKKSCGTSRTSSRFEQSVRSVQKLKADLARARARVQQESKLAEKRKRYEERHKVDAEIRMMGKMCQSFGLGSFRLAPVRDEVIGQIDAELVAGAIALLVEQIQEIDDDQRAKLKVSGSAYMQRVLAEQFAKQKEMV